MSPFTRVIVVATENSPSCPPRAALFAVSAVYPLSTPFTKILIVLAFKLAEVAPALSRSWPVIPANQLVVFPLLRESEGFTGVVRAVDVSVTMESVMSRKSPVKVDAPVKVMVLAVVGTEETRFSLSSVSSPSSVIAVAMEMFPARVRILSVASLVDSVLLSVAKVSAVVGVRV